MTMSLADSGAYGLVLLPLLVFCARILDVSIGTLCIIFVSRSLKGWAALFGSFESLIWVPAIGQVMQKLANNPDLYRPDLYRFCPRFFRGQL